MGRNNVSIPAMGTLRQTSMQDQAYNKLRLAIMSGEFKPAQLITIRTLSKELGTSPMPVRDALGRLATEGAVQVTENRSYIISPMTQDKLKEITKIRMNVEGLAAEQAAKRITKRELKRLEKISEQFNLAAEQGNLKKYLEYNQDFHFTIYDAARMPVLTKIIGSLWLQFGPALNELLSSIPTLEYDSSTHDLALAALKKGDEQEAKKQIMRDISVAAEEMLASDYFSTKQDV